MLACLGWLAEFQILACIPKHGTVSTSDICELVSVPESQLLLVVQTMATVRFLQMPEPGHVGHTALSAAFVTKPSLLDAALFMTEVGAPAAFRMADATKRASNGEAATAYSLASPDFTSFASDCKERPRLQRQWLAHLRYTVCEDESSVLDVLMQCDWSNLIDNQVVIFEARMNLQ